MGEGEKNTNRVYAIVVFGYFPKRKRFSDRNAKNSWGSVPGKLTWRLFVDANPPQNWQLNYSVAAEALDCNTR